MATAAAATATPTPEAAPATPWPAMSLPQINAVLTAAGAPFELETLTVRGVPTRCWKNAPPTLRETLAAGRAHGAKEFLVYEDERATFDAFHRAVAAFAAELVAQGVGKGDRVAVIMRNLPEWPVALYAAVALGAIVTPLNGWWTAPELEYGLSDSGTKVAVMDAARYADPGAGGHAAARDADVGALLPRHGLLGGDQPDARNGRPAGADAKVGPGARLPADRA